MNKQVGGACRQSDQRMIIAVDDSEEEFLILERMYNRSNSSSPLVHFGSGDDLLVFLQQPTVDPASIQIILIDLNMPGRDGVETVAAIRNHPRFRDQPNLTLLTSSCDPHDRHRAEAAGADDFIIKPMDATELIAFFNELSEEAEAALA